MSDTWYRDPFSLPPYPDGLGRSWSFTGVQVDGPPEPPALGFHPDWPEDLHHILFQAEFSLEFAARYREYMDREIDRLVYGNRSGEPKGFLGG